MDRTANPCQDFFQYACGAWNRKHIIPEDRSSISTFEVLADQLQVILKSELVIHGADAHTHSLFFSLGILEEDVVSTDNNATVKAKYFYQSCMDMGKKTQICTTDAASRLTLTLCNVKM